MTSPDTVILRPIVNDHIGTTSFFRNRILFETILNEFKESRDSKISVLFHSSSVGAEVYSFVIKYLEMGLDKFFKLQCYVTDIEQAFLDFSEKAIFPATIAQTMNAEEKSFFHGVKDKLIVKPSVREYVTFLPASSYTEFESKKIYDAVFLLNAFIYVPAEGQALTIDKISKYNKKWFITSGFHMEQIKADLKRNKYAPITNNIKIIHDSWLDRRIDQGIVEKREGIYTDWSLPKYSEIPDFEYKYCAVFAKN